MSMFIVNGEAVQGTYKDDLAVMNNFQNFALLPRTMEVEIGSRAAAELRAEMTSTDYFDGLLASRVMDALMEMDNK